MGDEDRLDLIQDGLVFQNDHFKVYCVAKVETKN